MYFRYYLSDAKENNTLETLVDVLILSTQLSNFELKDFLLSCFDRMKNGEIIDLSLKVINQYCQILTDDLYKAIGDQGRQEEAQRISKILYSLEELKRSLNAQSIRMRSGLSVNNPPPYFEITNEEYALYVKYKDMASCFQEFFSEFKAQGQANSRSRKHRMGSKLKYEYLLPEERMDSTDEDDVEIEIVEDTTQSQAVLTQFEKSTLQPIASSSTSSASSDEFILRYPVLKRIK